MEFGRLPDLDFARRLLGHGQRRRLRTLEFWWARLTRCDTTGQIGLAETTGNVATRHAGRVVGRYKRGIAGCGILQCRDLAGFVLRNL